MNVVTANFAKFLPEIPEGWSWHIREDKVDGLPKVIVYLRDEKFHSRGHATVDVHTDPTMVLDIARAMAKRLTP